MKIIKFFIFAAFCCTSAFASLDSICRSRITMLNGTDRNIATFSFNFKCDTGVSKGWYAFGKDRQLPRDCPKVGSCSAYPPLWTFNTQPDKTNPGPFGVTLCTSESPDGFAQCTVDCTTEIQAAYCSNLEMNVYEFLPVKTCDTRYCYAEYIPCDPGESSPTGFKPCEKNFPFEKLQNGTTVFATAQTDALFANERGVLAKCSIQCDELDCAKLEGDAYWYTTSSVQIIAKSKLKYDNQRRQLYSFLPEEGWKEHINNYLFCEISPTFNTFKPYKNLFTSPYYFGLYSRATDTNGAVLNYGNKQLTVTVPEGNDKFAKLEIFSSIPILCKNNNNICSLPISTYRDTIYNKTDLVRITGCNPDCEGCVRRLKPQQFPDPTNIATWTIYPTVEPANLLKPSSLFISLFVKPTESLESVFWRNLVLPTVKIEFIPRDLPRTTAHSLNDPHMRTHDGTAFEFHGRDGEYLIMKNPQALLWIHAISVRCNAVSTVWCNNKLYVQSIDDVVFHDVSEPNTVFYVDLKSTIHTAVRLPFDTKTGEAIIPKKNHAIKVFDAGNVFRIITHFSTTIEIYKNSGNYYIYASKYDKNQVSGLLGDYNKDPTDDLQGLALDAYLNKFKITTPLMSKLDFYPVTAQQIGNAYTLPTYCTCTQNPLLFEGESGFECPLGLLNTDGFTQTFDKLRKVKGFELTMDTLKDLSMKFEFFNTKRIHEKNSIGSRIEREKLKKKTMSSCEAVLNVPILRECHSQELVDLDSLIELCELDFQMTEADIWSEGYYSFALDTCKEKLTDDQNNFIEVDGIEMPQVDVITKLCPNDCSGNGRCSEEGKCICERSFDGFDCSFDISVPAEIFNSSSENNLCDLKDSDCLNVLLLLSRTSSIMNLNYDLSIQRTDGSLKLLERGTSNLLTFNDNVVYGKLKEPKSLPSGSLSVYFFKMAVKDISTSNSIDYVVMNSECHYCSDAKKCQLKSGKCDIDGKCYSNGEMHPNDSQKKCNSKQNPFNWSDI